MNYTPRLRSQLYVRADCVRCDEAELWLSARGISYELVDVDADPATAAAHGLGVPVLVDSSGRVHAWPFADLAEVPSVD